MNTSDPLQLTLPPPPNDVPTAVHGAAPVGLHSLFILITILITALYNLFFAGKNLKNHNNSFVWIITLCFGIIHGLGFSNYFKTLVSSVTPNKLATLFSFAIGIEVAQIIVAVAVLLLSFLTLTLSPLNKREFTLVASAFVLGVVVPLLLENPIFG